jgi:hypothetical protein
MGQAFDSLNESQTSAFQEEMTKLGIAHDALSHEGEFSTGSTPGPTIISSNPEESHIPPTMIPINSIADLKRLRGVPDEHYTSMGFSDSVVDYPEELPAERFGLMDEAADVCALREQLTPEEQDQIRQAAEAYVMGNSEKVQAYEPMINATMFPTQMAAVNGESLVVDKDHPLIIQGDKPVTLNYAKITVKPGGQIIIKTQANITAQVFESQSK